MSAPAPPKLAIPIDPRIKARRVEVTRTEGRRRLRLVVSAAVVVAVLAGVVGFLRSPLAAVDRVVLAGADRTQRSDVMTASGLSARPQMIDVDANRVASKVRALPWVRTARVTRHWPTKVSIQITERKPVMVVAAGKSWALVDGTGRVLARQAERPEGMVLVSGGPAPGPPGSQMEGDLAEISTLIGSLPPEIVPFALQVSINGDGVELLSGANSPVVRLGPPVELPQKIRAVQALLAGADMRRVTVIDVRVPSAPVLTRR